LLSNRIAVGLVRWLFVCVCFGPKRLNNDQVKREALKGEKRCNEIENSRRVIFLKDEQEARVGDRTGRDVTRGTISGLGQRQQSASPVVTGAKTTTRKTAQ
jgi:tetrahydromethanopterin S-methyltransferase subunit G